MTAWSRRSDRRSGDMAHGILFIMRERTAENVRAEVACGGQKVHLDGTASLTLALDQYKYGDELIAQLFTRQMPRFLERRAEGWSRVQIYLGRIDEHTMQMLRSLADEIEARLAFTADSGPIDP